ncbi:MAG TPA: cytochrome c biogenesis protein CcsA [Candidatus Cybelea sp.]|nr:cytochrome c biogenesis protein CcsA [Candidatus Cybelea sp.]
MSRELADLAVALYAASCACYVWLLYSPHNWLGRAATLLLSAGIVSEYFALLERSHGIHSVPYGDLYGSMSLFAWLLAVTYLGLEMLHRQRSVGAFVTLLLTIWTVGTLLAVPQGEPATLSARGALFALHVTLDTWAYAAFALSFVLSLIYLVQNWVLRTRKPTATFWRFPALDVLDRMARSSVSVGLLTLVCGVIMGLIWRHRLSGTYSWGDPKVIVTLAIFAVYIAYLALARSAGWRGARAAVICASNFLVVLFSYTFVNLYLTDFHRFY